jgi:hypothetical protein
MLHLKTTIGRVERSKLTPEHEQRLLDEKLKVLAIQTVIHIRTVLRTALQQALKWDRVTRNVVTWWTRHGWTKTR